MSAAEDTKVVATPLEILGALETVIVSDILTGSAPAAADSAVGVASSDGASGAETTSDSDRAPAEIPSILTTDDDPALASSGERSATNDATFAAGWSQVDAIHSEYAAPGVVGSVSAAELRHDDDTEWTSASFHEPSTMQQVRVFDIAALTAVNEPPSAPSAGASPGSSDWSAPAPTDPDGDSFPMADLTVAAGSGGTSAGGAKPVATIAQLADYLVNGFWQYNSTIAHHWASNTISYNISGLTSAEQFLAQSALEAWHEVANLNFVQTTGPANITFNHSGSMQPSKPTITTTPGS